MWSPCSIWRSRHSSSTRLWEHCKVFIPPVTSQCPWSLPNCHLSPVLPVSLIAVGLCLLSIQCALITKPVITKCDHTILFLITAIPFGSWSPPRQFGTWSLPRQFGSWSPPCQLVPDHCHTSWFLIMRHQLGPDHHTSGPWSPPSSVSC